MIGVSALVPFAFIAVVAGGVEAFRAKTRRRLVGKWASDQGFTLLECRYSFRPLSPSWLVPYRVTMVDKAGRTLTGTVWATGLLRREAWAEWGGSGRGQR